MFDLLKDPLQLHNIAGVESSALGVAAAAEMLPLGVALSGCSHTSCYRPAPATLPPLAPNATRLPCYAITKAPQHPEWPSGSCSSVGANHYFSGWACIPDPLKANSTVQLRVTLDGVGQQTLLANISRPQADSGRAPCGGAGARHGPSILLISYQEHGAVPCSAYRVETGPYFVPGFPHGVRIELRQAHISYQDNAWSAYRVETGPYFVPGLPHAVAHARRLRGEAAS